MLQTVLFRALSIFSVALPLAMFVPCYSLARARNRPPDNPLRVAESYLKAIQSRDFETAYGYISRTDRGVRDKTSYLRSQQILNGFALELAKRLAAGMEVWVTDQKKILGRIHLDLGYRLPAGDEIYPQVFEWNVKKLNALPEREQQRIVHFLQDLKDSGKMIMFQGHESLDVVHEKDGWRVFLGWPSRSRVIFKSMTRSADKLEIEFLRNDFLVGNNEPFDIDFTVKNASSQTVVATLHHRIEPPRLEKDLAMVACGALLPMQLQPGETRKISSSYVLGGLAPKTQVWITYQFTVASEARSPFNKLSLGQRKNE